MLATRVRKYILGNLYRRGANQRVRELEERQWGAAETHSTQNLSRLSEILMHASAVPYYAKHLSGKSFESEPRGLLQSLPVLEKQTIVEEGDHLLHPIARPAGIGTTSGSTGVALSFYYDDSMLSNAEALSRFFRGWYGLEPGDPTVRIWGRPLRGIKTKLRAQLSDWLRGSVTLDPWRLGPATLEGHWRTISRFRPRCIYGYATSLAVLAKWIEGCRLQDDARKLELKAIVSTAESLLPSDKQVIKSVFGCPVVEEYGAAEVSIMAHECPLGGLHIANESVMLEAVDDEGHDMPAGQAGHLLVTSFVNRAQPLLRYRIGDYGALPDRTCGCGRPTPLLQLTGAKIIELIRTKSGRIFSAEILDYINLALMTKPSVGIKQFRVTQKALDAFVVEIVPGVDFREQSTAIFANYFREQLGERNVTMRFILRETMEPLPSGKLLYFQSEVP